MAGRMEEDKDMYARERKKIRSVFQLFDKESRGCCAKEYAARALPVHSNQVPLCHTRSPPSSVVQPPPLLLTHRDVGTIMRYLGAYPTEEEIVADIIPSLQDETDLHNVKYTVLEPFLVRVTVEKLYEPDTEEVLLQAFRTLFPDKPYTDEATMAEVLRQGEYGFKEKEIDDFMRVAKSAAKSDSGLIYFEEYCAHTAKQ